jgi:hypothetical protein
MHNALPDSEITVFPNASHMAMYEVPELLSGPGAEVPGQAAKEEDVRRDARDVRPAWRGDCGAPQQVNILYAVYMPGGNGYMNQAAPDRGQRRLCRARRTTT